MSKERLYLFDTTLRDGAQTQGVDFSVHDKQRIAAELDALGLDYIEGGWPGANPTDTEFFASDLGLKSAKFTAFGMTHRPGRSAANDPGLSALLDSSASAICIVGKTWDYQVDVALEIPREENVAIIKSTMAEIVKRGREPLFDAEHFFDGYKANREYTLDCLKAAADGGARWLVLCDTNGGTLPHEVARIVGDVVDQFGGDKIGIHAHNDTENAVANTLAAIHAGARQAQGTLNGLGERCGNANMTSLIPTLLLKPEFADRFEIGVPMKNLKRIKHVSHVLDDILNRAPNRHQPYVGDNAFAHKGGLHASAVMKDPRTYEHVPPESVGNKRKILVSNQSGKANIIQRLQEVGIDIPNDHPKIGRLLDQVKEAEMQGLSYDGAEASFDLLARRALGMLPKYFETKGYRVLVERRHNAQGDLVTIAEATVKVDVDGEVLMSVGEGNGPVNALDQALRKDLGKYSSYLEDLRLVDYKVRILSTDGTESTTRVLIESADSKGESWFTVGVSPNIVDASYQALYDSLIYKLSRDGAPPAKH
ncbi:MAG: citramalate synthase [Proteobacteria bacterium]|nr:citramalate synthase [Pseudomonadota bacterium]